MSIVKDLLLVLFFIILIIRNIILYKTLLQERNLFINTLSHDLRVSAIAQIRGVECLEKNYNHEFVGEIKTSCLYSLDMINMLLNTYRFKNKENCLNYSKFNLSESIKTSCDSLKNISNEKNLRFYQSNKKELLLNADEKAINKVLEIIISTTVFNAEKNSIIYITSKKDSSHIEFSVAYEGKALSEEECKRMFSKNPRFSTVGHGIKLQLCKSIVDLHKGKIFVKNCGENINTFTIRLPIRNKEKIDKTLLISTLQASRL